MRAGRVSNVAEEGEGLRMNFVLFVGLYAQHHVVPDATHIDR